MKYVDTYDLLLSKIIVWTRFISWVINDFISFKVLFLCIWDKHSCDLLISWHMQKNLLVFIRIYKDKAASNYKDKFKFICFVKNIL